MHAGSAVVLGRADGLCAAVFGGGRGIRAASAGTYIQQERFIEEQIASRCKCPCRRRSVGTSTRAPGRASSCSTSTTPSASARSAAGTTACAVQHGRLGHASVLRRMQMTYIDWNAGDAYDLNEDDMFGPRSIACGISSISARPCAVCQRRYALRLQTRSAGSTSSSARATPVAAARRGAADDAGRAGAGPRLDQQKHRQPARH